MKRTPEATALRTRCAECTRATQPMQLACMCALCASRLVPSFHRTFVSEMAAWGTRMGGI